MQVPLQHPLLKYIEVTGIRVSVDLNRKSIIQYVVVNHSAADLAELTLGVTVRSVLSRPQQPPISVFTVKIPSLTRLNRASSFRPSTDKFEPWRCRTGRT